MKKEDTLAYIEDLTSALEWIDNKAPLLEHSDKELLQQKKKLEKLKHKLKGLHFIAMWGIFTLVGLIPMSLLNIIIDTDFNFLIITPLVSLIVLFLCKTKYSKGQQKTQTKAIEGTVKRLETENRNLIGEINYSANLADEALTLLMLDDTKTEYHISDCDLMLTNTVSLKYIYMFINKESPTANFKTGMQYFSEIIKNTENKQEYEDLLKMYQNGMLQAEYRRGVIKRCAKESAE